MREDRSEVAIGGKAPVPLRWRAFASMPEHSNIDFDSSDTPRTVTALLTACADGLNELEAWDLPVSGRIAGLLEILKATGGEETIESTVICACGERTSIELSIDELIGMTRTPEDVLALDGGLRFRRPRGSDQRRWREANLTDSTQVIGAMVEDLAVDRIESPLSGASIERIGSAFEEFDPLAAFRVDLACTHCGLALKASVDLQEWCLCKLRRAGERVIKDVHVLARAYGWSEEAILALPASRRQQYLRLIENDRQ